MRQEWQNIANQLQCVALYKRRSFVLQLAHGLAANVSDRQEQDTEEALTKLGGQLVELGSIASPEYAKIRQQRMAQLAADTEIGPADTAVESRPEASFFCSDSSDENAGSSDEQWEVSPEPANRMHVGVIPSPEIRSTLMQCTSEQLKQHQQSAEQCDRCMAMGSDRCMAQQDQLSIGEPQELDFTSWMQGDVVNKARNYIYAQEQKQASVSPPRNLAVEDVVGAARRYVLEKGLSPSNSPRLESSPSSGQQEISPNVLFAVPARFDPLDEAFERSLVK